MMDDKTRERYAAIGRGERLQWSANGSDWHDWNEDTNPPDLSNDAFYWRIAPPAPIPVELPRDVEVSIGNPETSGSRRVVIWFSELEQATAFVDTVRREQQK